MAERNPTRPPNLCGSVNEEVVLWGKGEHYTRTTPQNCKDCTRLKNVRRSCLRCSKQFQPMCKNPWHCVKCQGSKAVLA